MFGMVFFEFGNEVIFIEYGFFVYWIVVLVNGVELIVVLEMNLIVDVDVMLVVVIECI